MKALDKYILWSSIFALFTEDFSVYYGINIKLFYLIIFLNSLLLFSRKKLRFNFNLLYILGFVIIHGVIMFVWTGAPIKALLAQVFGIIICSVYYYNYIRLFDPVKVVDAYLKMAYWVAILALPMWVLGINEVGEFRLNGIMSEPAHYVAIMLPALYVYLKKREFKSFGVILLTILLSQSSIGYFGLLLVFTLPYLRLKHMAYYGKYLILIVLAIILFLGSQWNQNFNETQGNQVVRRVKQTAESFGAITTGVFPKQVNLSTYAILSNAYITGQSISNNPLGVGVGGYKFQYDIYFDQMIIPLNFAHSDLAKINREDGNSLLLRMLVDFGVFSVVFIGIVLYQGVYAYRFPEKNVKQGVFIYLLVKLIREGHYFPPEFYFFLILFFDKKADYLSKSPVETK